MTRNIHEELAREIKARRLYTVILEIAWREWVHISPGKPLVTSFPNAVMARMTDDDWAALGKVANVNLNKDGTVSTETRLAVARHFLEWSGYAHQVHDAVEAEAEFRTTLDRIFPRPSRN